MIGFDLWQTKKTGFESTEVFNRPPMRSRQFLSVTLMVILLLVLGCLLLVRLWPRLPMLSVIYIVMFLLIVGLQWLRVRAMHRKLHELYSSGQLGAVQPDSSLDLALRAASSLCFWSVFTPAIVGLPALMAIMYIFVHPSIVVGSLGGP